MYMYICIYMDVHTLRMTYYVETQVDNFTMNKMMALADPLLCAIFARQLSNTPFSELGRQLHDEQDDGAGRRAPCM